MRSLGHIEVQKEQVLHLTEQCLEDGIEVDVDVALFKFLGLLSNEKELVELVGSVLFDSSDPLLDLEVLKFTKVSD